MVVIGKFPEMEMESGCGQCPKRADCSELCETAEAYAGQDHTTFIGPVFLRDPLAPEPNAERINRIPADETLADMEMDITLGDDEAKVLDLAAEAGLTQVQRDCLHDHYWVGLSLREIARNRGVNASTVLKSIRGGRRVLRRVLYERLRYRAAVKGESAVKVGKSFRKVEPVKSLAAPLLAMVGICL